MAEKKNLYNEGLEKYPDWWVDGENLFYAVYIGIALYGMLPLRFGGVPVLSLFYAAFVIVMLGFFLRKHLCTHCYYYGKRCHTAWGVLSACLYKKESGNYELGIKVAGITWMLVTLIPIVGMLIVSYLEWPGKSTIPLLLIFLLLTKANLMIHKKSCEKCKMRFICGGSAAKR